MDRHEAMYTVKHWENQTMDFFIVMAPSPRAAAAHNPSWAGWYVTVQGPDMRDEQYFRLIRRGRGVEARRAHPCLVCTSLTSRVSQFCSLHIPEQRECEVNRDRS